MALLTIYQNCNSAINTSTRAVFWCLPSKLARSDKYQL